jgi:hypothetical protein
METFETGKGVYLLAYEICCWVVEEGFEHGHEGVFVLSEET